ncbi:MAG: malto-oligosyltrehalose trehalohydrolase [Thiohalobacteraceae bacterium]
MKRRHRMPFGAELVNTGGVRFRLWAPDAKGVELCLRGDDAEHYLPMATQEGGWFELTAPGANARSCYRFRIDGGQHVPDPAARRNPDDVQGPSEVTDPEAFDWRDGDWRGRPWEEAVIYELHVGSFSPAGDFAGVAERLDHLAAVGVTAVELMPLADFPGARNWGYDGVLPFAPDSRYGSPDDLKRLIQAAHLRGLMVFLDVVYNHFGPEGNYLHLYAKRFFTERHHTPWGAALNFDGPDSRTVRDFFIHNALYWLEEFHFDGLRFDAVHAIIDDSRPDLLEELAAAVQAGPGRERAIHLVLEDDDNRAHYLRTGPEGAGGFSAQWNDDIHHALHVLATGEADGYYADYAGRPLWYLGRCLSEGFAYQGEASPYRDGRPRGEPSAQLPTTAFVAFQQNHDQIGNRAFGERLTSLAAPRVVRATTAILLLAPAPPLLFMGEEFGAPQPFLFFCDFGAELAAAVTEGRRREFDRFARFAGAEAREAIPDPNAPETFERSRLDWALLAQPQHQDWLAFYRDLLHLRQREIVPRLSRGPAESYFRLHGEGGLEVGWHLRDAARLLLLANLADRPLTGLTHPAGQPLYVPDPQVAAALTQGELPPWTTTWWLDPGPAEH